ncbi:hypothetical protein MHYP_G00147860 [Metynnis hypsauchen]
MSGDISLFDLVNMSIGNPEPGAVNFSALHTLLHAMLEHLHIQNVCAVWRESDAGHDPGESLLTTASPQNPYRRMEDKLQHIERQLAALERLPSGSELLARSASVNDVWQLLQLRRRVEGSEDGVTKCMALIQDLLNEIQELKKSRDNLKKEVEALQIQFNQINVDQLSDRITAAEQCLHQVEVLKSATQELKVKVALYPQPEELTQCVTWEVMQAALVNERKKMQDELKDSITGSRLPLEVGIPLTQRGSSTAGFSGMADSDSATGPELGGSEISPSQQGPLGTLSNGSLPLLGDQPLSRVSNGAKHYPETVEALRDVGRLQEKHKSLEARVERLEGGERGMPENVLEQVNRLKALLDTIMADREKVLEMENLIMGTVSRTEGSDLGEESDSTSAQGKDSISASQQIAHLRNAVQKLDEDIKKLKKDVAAVSMAQKSSTDKQMQDQLDSLRSMLEDMMASSSAMLSWSLQQDTAELEKSGQGQGQGQDWGHVRGQGGLSGQAGPTCPSYMVNLSRKVSQLFQRYETLQSMVSGFMKLQVSGRTIQAADITSELMSEVQGAILQLQAECEKLHITANHLMEDHNQKQSHIDHLYKTVEELDEKKADREVVEMEIGIKADKRALETKVSRIQFDTMTEQLNGMFQELLSKITGQEQDWHKVIEKISTEMECKLNRIELDPLKKQLEDRWKSIRKQLQAQPAPEPDDAAGFRKQLVARFHCISCDRPVDMITPGPLLLTVPSAPGLPSHKSNRPYTVYELEQARHHSRSLRPGTNQGHFEMACAERSMAQMRQIHRMMCRQIDTVQSKLCRRRALEHPYSQGLREISQSLYPPILSSLQRTSHSLPKHERIPEMADYGYLAVSRSCGGSHTLTYANRRYSRLQHITQIIQTEDSSLAMSGSSLKIQPEEVDILGLDGHIYKGRLNSRAVKTVESRLPTITSKEGNCKSKDRVGRCQSQKYGRAESGHGSPLRPQSAKTQGSRSGGSQRHLGTGSHNGVGSNSSVKDRPVSSMDCLCQPSVPQSSADPDNEILQGRDFSQPQNEPVTSL